jgi:hypothetical protein
MFHLSDVFVRPDKQRYKQPAVVWDAVKDARLDLEFAESVRLDTRCTDKGAQERMSKGRDALAAAPAGDLQGRVRDLSAVEAVQVYYDNLHDPALKSQIVSACETKLMVAGGAQFAFGRILEHYPKRGSGAHLIVPSQAEVTRALTQCGLDNAGGFRLALSMSMATALEEKEIEVVADAENGFPTMGKFADEEARSECLRLAALVRSELETRVDERDMFATLAAMEKRDPLLFTVRGKAKSDMYKWSKVEGYGLRFYNVIPRPLVLVMQQATQVIEATTSTLAEQPVVGDNLFLATCIGMPLTGGGADALVTQMDWQLRQTGFARLHCGDDTWLAARTSTGVVLFSLDCTAFDLTQHGDVTKPIHDALFRVLKKVDVVSACVWYKMARERRTVLTGSIVGLMKHGGPSGMPLQSKVNDILMDVVVQRIIGALSRTPEITEEVVSAVVQQEGRNLGLKIRLECYDAHHGVQSIKEALEHKPFLFVGYYFHVRNGVVVPYLDIPRALSRLPYNSSFDWMERTAHQARTAIRIGGLVLSMGIPPYEQEVAFSKLVAAARFLLSRVLDTMSVRKEVEFQVNRLSHVSDLVKYSVRDVKGLLDAISASKINSIWLDPTELPQVGYHESWADATDAEEAVKKYTDFLGWLRDDARHLEVRVVGRIPPQKPVGERALTAALLGRPPAYRSDAEKDAAAVRRSRSQNVAVRSSRQRYEHMRQYGEWPEEDSRWSDEEEQVSLARYTESEYSEYDQWE